MMRTGKWMIAVTVVGMMWASRARAGDLTPPDAPGPTMKTLQQLWDRMETIQSGIVRNEVLLLDLATAQGLTKRTWQVSAVDTNGIVGLHTSLAFTPEGQPAISYYDPYVGDLKYAVSTATIVSQ